MPERYDVIVIGSDAGGGTLTHALAPTGHPSTAGSRPRTCPSPGTG